MIYQITDLWKSIPISGFIESFNILTWCGGIDSSCIFATSICNKLSFGSKFGSTVYNFIVFYPLTIGLCLSTLTSGMCFQRDVSYDLFLHGRDHFLDFVSLTLKSTIKLWFVSLRLAIFHSYRYANLSILETS